MVAAPHLKKKNWQIKAETGFFKFNAPE